MQTLKHWTTFRGKPNNPVRSEGMRVTMGRRGDIYLNKIAWESFGKPKSVELMFDKNRGVIGLKPVESWQENSFPLRDKKGAEGKTIHASPFCNHFSLRTSRTVLFNQAHIDDDGILSLPLDGITAIGRGSR